MIFLCVQRRNDECADRGAPLFLFQIFIVSPSIYNFYSFYIPSSSASSAASSAAINPLINSYSSEFVNAPRASVMENAPAIKSQSKPNWVYERNVDVMTSQPVKATRPNHRIQIKANYYIIIINIISNCRSRIGFTNATCNAYYIELSEPNWVYERNIDVMTSQPAQPVKAT